MATVGGPTSDATSDVAPSPTAQRAASRWGGQLDNCRIAISIKIPDTKLFVPSAAVHDEVCQILTGRFPELRIDRHSMTVSFFSDSKSPSDACMDAAGFTRKLTDILGQDETAAYNLRIAASEGTYPVLASKPSERDVPALAGVGEIADLLGVSKQRVHQLTASPEFPTPVSRLKATPVWRRADVEKFGRERRQTPGPRPVA